MGNGIGSRYQNRVTFSLDEGSREIRLREGFEGEEQMFARLIANWVYGGFLAGLLLLLLTPVLVHSWPVSLVTTFLCLPVYMVHQYEEHDNDRFRLFVNQKIGKRE